MEPNKTNKLKNAYPWLLVVNAIYFIVFYILMQIFS